MACIEESLNFLHDFLFIVETFMKDYTTGEYTDDKRKDLSFAFIEPIPD